MESAREWTTRTATDFDAIVIGAGVSGLYQLYRLRELGMTARVFEAGSGVGGTWYWNRYPGARFDSESWTYGYSFSQELLDEWDWEEHFAGQPETERYLNYVADKFNLRRDIQFSTVVTAAHYREDTRDWDVTLDNGDHRTARLLITAVGVLSAPTLPRIPGVETFKGTVLPYAQLAQGTSEFRRQASRGDRHWRDRHSDHHGGRQDRRAPDGVSAHGAMVGTSAQFQGHARGNAGHPRELPGHLRALPGNRRLLHPRP
jgi:phytoene dehydrogenase-like protein